MKILCGKRILMCFFLSFFFCYSVNADEAIQFDSVGLFQCHLSLHVYRLLCRCCSILLQSEINRRLRYSIHSTADFVDNFLCEHSLRMENLMPSHRFNFENHLYVETIVYVFRPKPIRTHFQFWQLLFQLRLTSRTEII